MSRRAAAAAVVLPLRATPQPSPHLIAGGDCGACVLGGLLGLTVPEVYERFVVARYKQMQSVHYDCMRDALERACEAAVLDAPLWPVDAEWRAFGLDGMNQYGKWQRYVRMALEAGYYGVTCVDQGGRGSASHGGNHWQLLCGWRPDPTGVTVIDEVLVSCSARHPDGRWISARDYTHQHGGLNVLLARPRAA